MNPMIENNDRRLPYALSEERFEALHDRIRERIAARAAAESPSALSAAPSDGPVRRVLLRVSLGVAAAAVLLAAVVTAHRLRQPAVTGGADIESLLSTASAETLQRAAAENYDDIFYNQQL